MFTTLSPRYRFNSTQLLIPIVFVIGTLVLMPVFDLFVYDNDEGINVIKAVLMTDGYPLYTATWSDQPPIFTQLLQFVFALFGETMAVARLLVLALTTLFVWAYTSTIRLHLGIAAAWVALALLMLSDNFLRLSVSVMIGLPALSFAMVAIYLLQHYKQQPRTWMLLLSALLMGLSIQTKFFTLILVPIIGLDLLGFGHETAVSQQEFWRRLGSAVVWGVTIVAVYLAIGLYYQALDLDMLLNSHLSQDVQAAYADESSWAELRDFMLYDYGHLLLALLGLGIIAMRRMWHGLLPIGWLLLASVLLLNHRPVWYHHYQLISIPLCWLATYAVVPLFDNRISHPHGTTMAQATTWGREQWWRALLGVQVALVLGGLIYLRSERTIPYYNQRPYDQEIVDQLSAHAAETNWVFTDRAIYPFYAGLPVPPEIAVFSRKRFFGENLDNQLLLGVMEKYHPEQVLLTRFQDELLTDPRFVTYLDGHYTKIQENPDYVYYRLH